MGTLLDYQVLASFALKLGRYCALNFEKSRKFVKVWGPLTQVTGGNSKII